MLDKRADLSRRKDRIHPQVVAHAASDLARPDAAFVFDTGLNTLWCAAHRRFVQQYGGGHGAGSDQRRAEELFANCSLSE
jgi:thiamine pyrophosphate-dependent acetolactate synthase large subunit-like protein